MKRTLSILSMAGVLAITAACQTANQAGNAVKSVGSTVANGAGDLARGAVSLVNVDLSNVLNDLALDLKIDKANVPINAQIPVTAAANVCGVTINILSISTGGSPTCTARTTSPELTQAVQQQLAANGSVGGGAQSTSSATPTTGASTPAPTATSPSAPSGTASGTAAPAPVQ